MSPTCRSWSSSHSVICSRECAIVQIHRLSFLKVLMRSYLQEMVEVVVVEDLEILPIYRSIARCRLWWQSHFCCFFWSAGLKVEARHARSGLVELGLGVRSLRCQAKVCPGRQGRVRSGQLQAIHPSLVFFLVNVER